MRGGARKGAGAKKKEIKNKIVAISLPPDLVEKTAKINRSGLIQSLLIEHFDRPTNREWR